MSRHSQVARPLAGVAALMLVGLGLAACGDDSSSSSGAATTVTSASATTIATPPTSADAVSTDAYCSAEAIVETLPQPNIDDSDPADKQAAAVKEYAATQFKPAALKVQAVAPTELQAPIAAALKIVDQVAASGDPSPLQSDEFQGIDATLHTYDLAHCNWKRIDVVASEYKFTGLPATIPAGLTSFEMSNTGNEFHMMELARKKPGVTDSFDTLLTLPDAQVQAKADELGGIEPTAPGKNGHVVMNLTPGQYLAVCFLPVGSTTMEKMQQLGSTGTPHFMEGMKMEFTVS